MAKNSEMPKIQAVYQRSAALFRTDGPTSFSNAEFVLLAEGLGLYLPHDGRLLAKAETKPDFQPVRSVLATTATGFGVIITHGDDPSEDSRVFYRPTESVQLARGVAQCVEEDNHDTVTALVNAVVLPPTRQIGTDTSALIRDRLERTLDRLGPAETSKMVLEVKNGANVGSQAVSKVTESFVLTENQNPKLYYAENPELFYERRQHLLTKARSKLALSLSSAALASFAVSETLFAVAQNVPGPAKWGVVSAISGAVSAFAFGKAAAVHYQEARAMVPFDPRSSKFLPSYSGASVLPSGGTRRGR